MSIRSNMIIGRQVKENEIECKPINKNVKILKIWSWDYLKYFKHCRRYIVKIRNLVAIENLKCID